MIPQLYGSIQISTTMYFQHDLGYVHKPETSPLNKDLNGLSTGSEITHRCSGRGAEILYHEEMCYEYTVTRHYLRCDELFKGQAMEYLTKDTYGVVDKIYGLNEALGYLLLDESELPDDLVAATKRLREQLKHFQDAFTNAQSQEQT